MSKFSIFGEIVAVAGKRAELVDVLLAAEQLLLAKDLGCCVYTVNTAA